MSTTINPTIAGAAGYTETAYNSLIRQARAEKADLEVVDSLLFLAIQGGKSFTEAKSMVEADLPKLDTPTGAAMVLLKNWPGLPSPGALIMSANTEYAAEQRRQNQEIKWATTEAITASMKDQAAEMRSAAMTQLIMGIVSGVVQIGMGLVQIGMSGVAAKSASAAGEKAGTQFVNDAGAKAGNKVINQGKSPAQATAAMQKAMNRAAPAGEKIASETFSSSMMKANMTIGAVGQMGGGVAKIIDSSAQYIGAEVQAKLKIMEADQEKMRALRDTFKDLDETLLALIQKSLAAQNDMQSSNNQGRTRILLA
jgi:hypothetical protein